ncbi:hypothetical protein [Providencia manganoxydans]
MLSPAYTTNIKELSIVSI